MKLLGLAMHNYNDQHGRLQLAVVYGEDGKPLYSWRVLSLPYIEQQGLYQKFNLDEAWDSPHNIELLSEMPTTYAPPPGKRAKAPANHTVCKVFVGKGAAFDGHNALRMPADFPNRTSNTSLVIETAEAVAWNQAVDPPSEPHQPVPH